MALQPAGSRRTLILTALWHFGRGVAQAARGNENDAVKERRPVHRGAEGDRAGLCVGL